MRIGEISFSSAHENYLVYSVLDNFYNHPFQFNKVAEKRQSDAGALANAKRIRHPSRKVAATETNVQKAPLTSTQSVALHYVSPTFSHAPTSSTNSVQCTSSLENVVVKKKFNDAPKKILFWQINGLVAAIRVSFFFDRIQFYTIGSYLQYHHSSSIQLIFEKL